MRQQIPSVLIVHADKIIVEALETVLAKDFQVITCFAMDQMLEILNQRTFTLVLCSTSLPGTSGESVLSIIHAGWPGTEVLMIASEGDRSAAIRCLRLGAHGYIMEKWHDDELKILMAQAAEKSRLVYENLFYKQYSQFNESTAILGSSPGMMDLKDTIARLSDNEALVLIQGEHGTGKRSVAQAIHAQGSRKREVFAVVDCGAGPNDLIELDLFGQDRGATNSARSTRIGKFEYASGGTLYLNQVDALEPAVQGKLLRTLQERGFFRPSSKRRIAVDVRVIASTSNDLGALVRRGKFLPDLFHVLSGTLVQIPPLRERGDDVTELTRAFLVESARRAQKTVPQTDSSFYEAVRTHPFKGNVRELKHLVEFLFMSNEGENIDVSSLPIPMILQTDLSHAERSNWKKAVRVLERHVISRVLRDTNGNQSKASILLGIHRNTLLSKMTELEIPLSRT